MERRELLQILAVLPAASMAAAGPQFFTAAEYEKLGLLSETLLPGAREANTGFFIDTVLRYASPETQAEWRRGLTLIAPEAFDALAAAELRPQSEAERFFVGFKRLVLEAYFHSDAAMQFFGYKGNTAVSGFAACPGERKP
jgi:hypothetical protein